MPLNFPSSPATNAVYTYNSKTYRFDGTVWRPIADQTSFVLNMQVESVLQSNEIVGRHIAVDPFRIPAGATGSLAKFDVAANAATTFSLSKNGAAAFGTIIVPIAGTAGTWTVAAATDFAIGDVYTVIGPTINDLTLRAGAIVTRCIRT